MNNIQQLRVQLEKMFESMGGDKLEADAANILKDLQQQLNGALDDLAVLFAGSLEPRITGSVKEVGDVLATIKGGGQVSLSQSAQRNNVAGEADEVLRPLMVLLDGSLSVYAESCEKTVLKRLLKELWKIVMRILEKTVVLPPMTDKSVSIVRTIGFSAWRKIAGASLIVMRRGATVVLQFSRFLQMMFKNLTDNAKNLAANAKIEDMSKLFKNHMAGKPDVKNALSGVMVISFNLAPSLFSFPPLSYFLVNFFLGRFLPSSFRSAIKEDSSVVRNFSKEKPEFSANQLNRGKFTKTVFASSEEPPLTALSCS